MHAWKIVCGLGLAAIGAASALGCGGDDSQWSEGYPGSGPSGGSSGGSATGSTQPMLVIVDPNETMNASPGEGVGVFIQYKTGGHWDVWWTCDTNKTSQECGFDNIVTVSTGSIANVQSQFDTANSDVDMLTSGAQRLEAVTTTSTGIDGITFDTPITGGQTPMITVDAEMNGVQDGSFFFFVQDGQIKGGYSGMLTDPLMVMPKTP